MTRAGMLASMPAWELDEWRALASKEPVGEARADYHAAMITAAVINAMRVGGKPATIADVLPDWDKAWAEPVRKHRRRRAAPQPGRQTAKQMYAALAVMFPPKVDNGKPGNPDG